MPQNAAAQPTEAQPSPMLAPFVEPEISAIHPTAPFKVRLDPNPWNGGGHDDVSDFIAIPAGGTSPDQVMLPEGGVAAGFGQTPRHLPGCSFLLSNGRYFVLCYGEVVGSIHAVNASPSYRMCLARLKELTLKVHGAKTKAVADGEKLRHQAQAELQAKHNKAAEMAKEQLETNARALRIRQESEARAALEQQNKRVGA